MDDTAFDAEALKGSEELINFLENKLEVHEKNLAKRQYEYDALQADYQLLEERYQMTQQKYKRAALLLTEFLEDLLNDSPNILQTDKDLHLNVEKIKDTPFD
jgi:hypothetical protein